VSPRPKIGRPSIATRRPAGDSYERVYRVVRRIPRGRVATYGGVAAVAGLPGRARLVGYALYASGPHRGLPWHRVLGAGGRITLAKLDPDAALTQRLRLESEGVRFDGHGRADLAAHAWPASPRVGTTRGTRARKRARRRAL
jgi:methylated-DNA-protein-cysteine methyltransferase-like protein